MNANAAICTKKNGKPLTEGVSRSVQRASWPRYQEVMSLSSAPATGWILGITPLV